MAFFPNKGDEPGNTHQVALSGEPGDQTVQGDFTVIGTSHFSDTIQVDGDLLLGTTSIVEVFAGTTYTFGDPLLDLNTTFTGSYIPEAGVKIFRGDLLPSAQILFSEDLTRTTLEWRVGLAGDMLRIGRVADAMTDQHPLIWNVATSAMSSHPNIAFNPTNITSSIPIQFDLPAGQPASYIRHNEIIDPEFSVQRYAGGLFADALQMGFRTVTYDATLFTGAAALSGENTMLFRIRTPTHDRARYIFDGVASIGLDDATTAIIRSDLATTRIEAATTVGLRAGVAGADQLTATAAQVTSAVDFSWGANLASGDDAIFAAAATASESFYLPIGLTPLPTIVGWDNICTFDGVDSTLSSSEVTACTRYEIKIAHTIAGGAGTNYTVYTPINIGNDMDNIRSICGVVRSMAGAVVQRVYGLPPNDISVELPFDIDPPLTIANLVGYHLLSINMVRVVGSWEIIVTIETKHPLLHAP